MLAPDPALDSAKAARGGRLRRATRYLVNGILDVTIRRFRAAEGGGAGGRRRG
jgi:hypothetical protein